MGFKQSASRRTYSWPVDVLVESRSSRISAICLDFSISAKPPSKRRVSIIAKEGMREVTDSAAFHVIHCDGKRAMLDVRGWCCWRESCEVEPRLFNPRLSEKVGDEPAGRAFHDRTYLKRIPRGPKKNWKEVPATIGHTMR